jgi:ribosomal protein L7/L12
VTVTVVIALVLLAGSAAAFLLARIGRAREAKRPRVPVNQARPEVLSVAAGGSDRDRVRAIKVLRERTGLGLREAHDTVMRWLREDSHPSQ